MGRAYDVLPHPACGHSLLWLTTYRAGQQVWQGYFSVDDWSVGPFLAWPLPASGGARLMGQLGPGNGFSGAQRHELITAVLAAVVVADNHYYRPLYEY